MPNRKNSSIVRLHLVDKCQLSLHYHISINQMKTSHVNFNPLCLFHFIHMPLCFLCGRLVTHRSPNVELVSWSLTSLFSTNMAISEIRPDPTGNWRQSTWPVSASDVYHDGMLHGWLLTDEALLGSVFIILEFVSRFARVCLPSVTFWIRICQFLLTYFPGLHKAVISSCPKNMPAGLYEGKNGRGCSLRCGKPHCHLISFILFVTLPPGSTAISLSVCVS